VKVTALNTLIDHLTQTRSPPAIKGLTCSAGVVIVKGTHPQFEPESPVTYGWALSGPEFGHVSQSFNGATRCLKVATEIGVKLIFEVGERSGEGSCK
jgi:hypothetical protein